MRQRFVQLQERFHQRQQQRHREHETVVDLLPPPEPAQQQQQQQQRGIPTSVIVRAPPRNLATTQLFPDVQPSTSGVQQSGQRKKGLTPPQLNLKAYLKVQGVHLQRKRPSGS